MSERTEPAPSTDVDRWMQSERHREWAQRIARFLLIGFAVGLAYGIGAWLTSR
jgi:hypothetical protein